jgi:hypothetical protein
MLFDEFIHVLVIIAFPTQILTTDHSVFPDMEISLTTGLTNRQGLFTPPRHRISPTYGVSRGLCLFWKKENVETKI